MSVVIPAHNAERHLARALDSVFAQSYRPLQVIVIDDGSTDGTNEVASTYGSSVKLLRLPETKGVAEARNAGINAASGEYVAFLDADDEWYPQKTLYQVLAIEKVPAMSFISCAAEFVSNDPNASKLVHEGRIPHTGAGAWKALLAYPFVSSPSVLARKKALRNAGPFNAQWEVAEDQDMWIRLARLGEVGYLDQVLVRVHDTPDSLMKKKAKLSPQTTMAMIEQHVQDALSELNTAEVRWIFAERSSDLGRNACEAGAWRTGAQLLLRSVMLGRPLVPNLRHLALATPPARLAKAGGRMLLTWMRRG